MVPRGHCEGLRWAVGKTQQRVVMECTFGDKRSRAHLDSDNFSIDVMQALRISDFTINSCSSFPLEWPRVLGWNIRAALGIL